MILFVYGLFGFAYAVIMTTFSYLGQCNAKVVGNSSGADPPLEPKCNVQRKPLGFGLSMGKLHKYQQIDSLTV